MDVHESKEARIKKSAVETSRPSSILSERNNEMSRKPRVREPRVREISSRYMSPTPGPRRSPSPVVTRPTTPSRQAVPKRAVSADRKRPSTPPSSPKTSTPVHETLPDTKLVSRKVPEGLWPSTMRSLSVSFQSDAYPLKVSKKEKPVSKSVSDRALRPSPNMSVKSVETAVVTRKSTPERKKSPLKGKNAPDQLENSKPVDVVQSRLVEQHMWPGRTGGKLSSNALTRSVDLNGKNSAKVPSFRRMSIPDGLTKPLQKSSTDVAQFASLAECGILEPGSCKPVSIRPLRKINVSTPGARSHSVPTTPGSSRASSPSKAPMSLSRGSSPSRTRSTNSTPRGVSPSHSRPSSPSGQSSNSTTSVLSFIADIKKGKNVASHLEDVHELRLLYNRHLQWRFANARANANLHSQKVQAERMLYSVWETTSELWDFVIEKRNDLQQLSLRLKLYTVLKEQMAYLEGWGSCESEHTNCLSHAVMDLRSSIIRLPITSGAMGDIETVKEAVCSALNVMRAIGISISSILARVDGMNNLVSELADVAARGRAMTNGCESLLSSVAALQVEEYSLRTHLIQMKEN